MSNAVLENMLERLYAAMSSGPALNCRPHSSRQRVDVAGLDVLERDPGSIVAALLSDKRRARLTGPTEREAAETKPQPDPRVALLKKLRTIGEDARLYEQDTGAQVLFVGFPLLQLPPRKGGARVLAPVAFIPVALSARAGARPTIELEAIGTGAETLIPNPALMAWVEQQTGHELTVQSDAEAAGQPWAELQALTTRLCAALELTPPPLDAEVTLAPIAKSDSDEANRSAVLASAVLGLFPLGNQNLIEDTRAMLAGEALDGPVSSFLRADDALARELPADPTPPRLVASADPCQTRAVRLARHTRGLVVHGPPGTGKSQTIANIIGDHLARGERVLFVCDKRGALDVVFNRLEHQGLGALCAVVHDARKDQRDLYLGIREQLDGLAETTVADPVAELQRVDGELSGLHASLSGYLALLSTPPAPGEPSFHALTGQWLSVQASHVVDLGEVRPAELLGREHEVREAHARAVRCDFARNPWRHAVGVSVEDFLTRPVADWRRALAPLAAPARAADAELTAGATLRLEPGQPLREQARALHSLSARVADVQAKVAPERLAALSGADSGTARRQLDAAKAQVDLVREGPLDAELAVAHGAAVKDPASLALATGTLDAWLAVARRWYGFFFFWRRSRAAALLAPLGLLISPETAERVRRYFAALRARLLVRGVLQQVAPALNQGLTEAQVDRALEDHLAIFGLLGELESQPALAHLTAELRAQLTAAELPATLARTARLAEALATLTEAASASGLFTADFVKSLVGRTALAPLVDTLSGSLDTLETLLRLQRLRAQWPAPLASQVTQLLDEGVDADAAWAVLHKSVLDGELRRRLRADPAFQAVDGEQLSADFARHRALEARRIELTRAHAKAVWLRRQRERLLASTGGRLNSAGAELRRRLFLRGEKALRVRQVIAAGTAIEGGDPLFDVRPVWMASPGTASQIFPRTPIFDVVIFDEASQCRLEEALPVLTRARRVVIAGDPKQLPPTRFFESAVSQSQTAEPETDQELFEEQQKDVEDLLAAALNLEVEHCYLDVHYRSANADLISFSNEHFYEQRLQAVPAHPTRVAALAPIRLVAVNGTYDKRVNAAEAKAVVELVKELLARPTPPSIGVACFNLTQREAIVEALDEAAAADEAFATRLASARERVGAGSFEGFFVKNLENVQGDERDHIIISTTYGPAPNGRFYRRFGPLGTAGGGRRLNVLVTRARQQIHLLTSIPRESWLALPPVPAGQQPNGVYLLMAYLRYAEELEQRYREADAVTHERPRAGRTQVYASRAASPLAEAMGHTLSRTHGLQTDVHWGNDGFLVDVALRGDLSGGGVVGVCLDGTRYDKADDALEWDLFAHAMLAAQGWTLERLWSPHVYRELDSTLARLANRARTTTLEPSAS
ncbi:MAG: AAA domain-containing protein [Myxococcota bacterium]